MFDIEALIETVATCAADLDDAALVEHIAGLERLKGAASAAQVRLTAAFDRSQRARAAERGVPKEQQGRGIAEQVALARRESPTLGSRHLGMARALVGEMPRTLAALTCGDISEYRAQLMVKETAALTREDRTTVDADLGPWLATMGDRQVAAEARRAGYRLEPYSLIRRTSRAEQDRCVTVRPAPDTMTYLTGLLPVAQGVAIYATLRKHAESLGGAGDTRSLGQLMADTLVERVTGLTKAGEPRAEVHLVMTDRALVGLDNEPAEMIDGGPIPAWLARRTVHEAHRVWIRRLFARPSDGQLVSTDSRRRLFSGVLRDLVVARDHTCRTPWCDAPIRHADHVRSFAAGGETTLENAQGLCERCNHAKEVAGWRTRGSPEGAVETVTPTGRRYLSYVPPPPGRVDLSWVEGMLEDLVIGYAA